MKSYKSVFNRYGFNVLAVCDDNGALSEPVENEGEEAPESSKELMVTYTDRNAGDFNFKMKETPDYNVIAYKNGSFKFNTHAFVGLLLSKFFEKGEAENIASKRGEHDHGNLGQYVTLDKKAVSFLKDNCDDYRYYFINDRVYDVYKARNTLMRKLHAYASKRMVRDMEVGLANLALVEIADAQEGLGCFCGVETSLHVVRKESKYVTKGAEQRKYKVGNGLLLICDANDYSKVSAKTLAGIAAHLRNKLKKESETDDGLPVSKDELVKLIESHGFKFNLIKAEEGYFEVEIAPKMVLSVEIVKNEDEEMVIVAVKQEVNKELQDKMKVTGYSSKESEMLKLIESALVLASM